MIILKRPTLNENSIFDSSNSTSDSLQTRSLVERKRLEKYMALKARLHFKIAFKRSSAKNKVGLGLQWPGGHFVYQ